MNEMPEILWSVNKLTITKINDSSYRLTDEEIIVADFTSFELAVSYAYDEFIL